MQVGNELIIAVAALLAGMVNSIAGGGTLISFPTLLWLGRPPIMANATSTVALWPGSFAAMLGFRRDLATARRWLLLLSIPSLLGGCIGAFLLLRTPTSTFERLIPFLILGATLLLALQEPITRKLALPHGDHQTSRSWIAFAFGFQFLVGIYGGYFGAGIGILMLAALGLMGLADLHQMNGLKNLLALFINGIAAVYFAVSGAVIWTDALVMAVGAMSGGWIGARLAHRVGRKVVRRTVVVIGIVMTVATALRLT